MDVIWGKAVSIITREYDSQIRMMLLQAQGQTYQTWAEANTSAIELIRQHGPEKAVETLVLGSHRAQFAAEKVAEIIQAEARGTSAVTPT